MTAFDEAEKIPATLGDLAIFGMQLTIEIVSALCPDPKLADQKLEDIGSRLLDMVPQITHARSQTLFAALAEKLIHTEAGSL